MHAARRFGSAGSGVAIGCAAVHGAIAVYGAAVRAPAARTYAPVHPRAAAR